MLEVYFSSVKMLSIAYNLGFHVAEGEKAQGHSENRELHSEEVPKAP